MIIVDTALKKRQAEGRPIRVGMFGAGFIAAGVARQLLRFTTGLELSVVASRRVDPALDLFRSIGLDPRVCNTQAEIEAAIADGVPVVTEDAFAMARAGNIDVFCDVTGSIEDASAVMLAAIEAGKHIVHMNAEADGTVGPILKQKADKAGVIYSFSDGDQPGVEMNLYRFLEGMGIRPVLCGNIKGLHDRYRNPTTQEGYAKKWGQKAAMVTNFADGTKVSFEQAIVANGTGMRVAKRGMLGPDFSGGDPYAPLVPIEETISAFAPHLDAHLAAGGPGIVDYVVGARPGPGIFVVGTATDEIQTHRLNLYKMGTGPYYCFYTPYHLCSFEMSNSIARAVLFQDAVLAPLRPEVGVLAMAKIPLSPGDEIVELGGYHVYGECENIDVMRQQNLLPIGLAVGCRVIREVPKDAPLTFADVQIPAGRTVDALYAEQERVFGGQGIAAE